MIDLCREGQRKTARQHDLDTRRLGETCACSRALPGTDLKLIVQNKLEHAWWCPYYPPQSVLTRIIVIFCHFWVMSVKGSLLIRDFLNNDLPLEAFSVEAICVTVNRKRD